MNITWPNTLPLPSVEGYGLTPQEAVLRTDMESGPARQRRRFRQTPTRITVRWLFSEFEFALFEAWYKYHADEGGQWSKVLTGASPAAQLGSRWALEMSSRSLLCPSRDHTVLVATFR